MEAARVNETDKVVRLEAFRALREKLAAESVAAAPPTRETVPTGIRALDEAAGGLLRGTLTEFSGSSGCGSLFFSALLDVAGRERWRLALVDAGDQFEPADWDAAALRRVLWVRCPDARKALRAADLLLRDGNLPLVVLDLHGLPAAQLRKIPPNAWHRFQRVVEESRVTMVVLSARPTVEGARVRIESEARFGLDAMRVKRRELAARLPVRVRNRAAGWDAARRTA
jgi:hypothetical protein